MNIKRNIIFALESRKKDGVPIVENVPIRMRVNFASQRIEFTTGYRIDVHGLGSFDSCTQSYTQILIYPRKSYDFSFYLK